MENYAFVSEKIIDGKEYIAYRSIIDPRNTLVTIDGESMVVEDLKSFWETL